MKPASDEAMAVSEQDRRALGQQRNYIVHHLTYTVAGKRYEKVPVRDSVIEHSDNIVRLESRVKLRADRLYKQGHGPAQGEPDGCWVHRFRTDRGIWTQVREEPETGFLRGVSGDTLDAPKVGLVTALRLLNLIDVWEKPEAPDPKDDVRKAIHSNGLTDAERAAIQASRVGRKPDSQATSHRTKERRERSKDVKPEDRVVNARPFVEPAPKRMWDIQLSLRPGGESVTIPFDEAQRTALAEAVIQAVGGGLLGAGPAGMTADAGPLASVLQTAMGDAKKPLPPDQRMPMEAIVDTLVNDVGSEPRPSSWVVERATDGHIGYDHDALRVYMQRLRNVRKSKRFQRKLLERGYVLRDIFATWEPDGRPVREKHLFLERAGGTSE